MGGLAGFITAVVTGVVSVANYRRQGRMYERQEKMLNDLARHGAQLSVVEEHVNGLNLKIERGAFAQGKAAGVEQERRQPMSPTKDTQP